MDEIAILKDICDEYEAHILTRYRSVNNFYFEAFASNEYDLWKNELAKLNSLTFIGAGACCEVFLLKEYVIKFHTPFNERITLLCNPTLETAEVCRRYRHPCPETAFYDPSAVEHFLFYEYITKNGLGAIQRYVACDENSRYKAYELFSKMKPNVAKTNHIRNFGMDGSKPVIIDWF